MLLPPVYLSLKKVKVDQYCCASLTLPDFKACRKYPSQLDEDVSKSSNVGHETEDLVISIRAGILPFIFISLIASSPVIVINFCYSLNRPGKIFSAMPLFDAFEAQHFFLEIQNRP
jgi:hypothetical protein